MGSLFAKKISAWKRKCFSGVVEKIGSEDGRAVKQYLYQGRTVNLRCDKSTTFDLRVAVHINLQWN